MQIPTQPVAIPCALGNRGNPDCPFIADGYDGCLTIRDTNGRKLLTVTFGSSVYQVHTYEGVQLASSAPGFGPDDTPNTGWMPTIDGARNGRVF